MPDGCEKVSMSKILTYEEIERICRVAADLGINRIKITGGEPFVRLGCTDLIRNIKATDGIEEVTVTTNGQTLDRYIDELKEIGVDGINISLDTLDPEKFAYITGGGELAKTLRSVELSAASGIETKVKCLMQKGFNEDELADLAGLAGKYGIDVRFIELMPIGCAYEAGLEGIPLAEVRQLLQESFDQLQETEARESLRGPAEYVRPAGFKGKIGFIDAMEHKFCSSCNRLRLTAEGFLKLCLHSSAGLDLRTLLRQGMAEDDLTEAIAKAVRKKPAEHLFSAIEQAERDSRYMYQVGG
jgi:cyclic pyranopterin phosphate synthase